MFPYLPYSLRIIAAVLLLSPFPGRALAGEIHEGQGATKIAAVQAANKAALQGAKTKDTGWKPARLQDVIRNKDGTWTAHADSANHKSSLSKGGYRLPGDALPQFDDVTPQTPDSDEGSNFEREVRLLGRWSTASLFLKTPRFRSDGLFYSEGIALARWKLVDSDVVLTPYESSSGAEIPLAATTWKLSEDGQRLSGRAVFKGEGSDIEWSLDREYAAYLNFAAVYERFGKDISKARIVVDRVESGDINRARQERSLTTEVQSQFQTLNSTWVIKVIPSTAHAIIYSFEMYGGKTLGIDVAEGLTPEKAEKAMASQLKRFTRKNTEIIRRWPEPSPALQPRSTTPNPGLIVE